MGKEPHKRATNLVTIHNALLKALEGAANAAALKRMQESITANAETCQHFLILFRRGQHFSGLYKYEEGQDITKLDGSGPKVIKNDDISQYFKFDTPKRQFTEVQTKHIGLTIIAFAIQDHVWPRKSLILSNNGAK